MKTKIKYFITILMALFLVLLALTSTAQATTLTQADLKNILDVIPNEIKLDITELEYKKAETMLKQEVEKIWKEKNIDTSSIEISYVAPIFVNEEDLYKAEVSVQDKETGKISSSKSISIKYNNTDNKNEKDAQYVKNLEIKEIKYYEVPLNNLTNDVDNCASILEKEYMKSINDKTINVTTQNGAGEIRRLNVYLGSNINIFKNGIYYNTIQGMNSWSIPVINVPSTVTDQDMNVYVKNLITKYYKELGEKITKIEKGNKTNGEIDSNVENGYTIFFKDLEDFNSNYIIIRKEKAEVKEEDKTTGIKLETNTEIVPANTVLETKEIKEEKTLNTVKKSVKDISNKFVTYDITLKSEGVAIQPNGKVKINIPIPNGFDKSKISVYRVAEDGTRTKYDTKIDGDYAVFETDHFSTYVLAENNVVVDNNKDKELDETPKTGTTTFITSGILSISLIALIGIVVLKKNSK